MRFALSETSYLTPVIKIIGYIPAGLTLTYGEKSFVVNQTIGYDGIIINHDAEKITRMSDGANIINMVNPEFFTFSVGNNQIIVLGADNENDVDIIIGVPVEPDLNALEEDRVAD
ncbi:MAG: hypothetical protein QM689_12770 [Oscillospiraceae bacterium]